MNQIIVRAARGETTHTLVEVNRHFIFVQYGTINKFGQFVESSCENIQLANNSELSMLFIDGAWDLEMLYALVSHSGQPEEINHCEGWIDEIMDTQPIPKFDFSSVPDDELGKAYKRIMDFWNTIVQLRSWKAIEEDELNMALLLQRVRLEVIRRKAARRINTERIAVNQ